MIYQGKNIIGQYLGTQSIIRKYLGDVLFWEYAANPKCDILVTYNVTSTTAQTTLIGSSVFSLSTQKKLDTVMYVDGKEQPLAKAYTFPTTGLHTVGFNTIVDTLDGALFSNVNILMATANTNITKVEVGFGKTLTTLTATASGSGTSTKAIGAFGHCTSLKEVIVGPSITTITGPVFGMCTSLEKATIGENVTDMSNYNGTSVDYGVFQKDTALMEIRFEGTTAPFVGANAIPTSNEGLIYHPCGSDYSQVMSTCQEEIDGVYYAWREECFSDEPEITDYDILAVYDVTSTVSSTLIYAGYPVPSGYTTDNIAKMYIDDIEVEPKNQHRFSTLGEHTVKYKLVDNTSIGHNAFYGCSGLTSITIPDSVTSIGHNAFENCSSLTSITIPDSVISIDKKVFYGCCGLTSVDLGNGVTSIGESAFFHCCSLTSIDIPDSVTSIDINAFQSCGGVTSITLGSGITSIGIRAFDGCNKLSTITCKATKAPEIASNSFKDVMENGILYYPSGSDYSSWMKTSSYRLGSYNWTSESF